MMECNTQTEQAAVRAREILAFDWASLTALGVTYEEAQTIAITLALKKTMAIYWHRLVRSGVPVDDARRIARAIAKYDVSGILPNSRQKRLISKHCATLCRAKLWRSGLLLPATDMA